MVMMLLLSTIGLSSMRSSKLETMMSRNFQQKFSSFNNAESAVLVGEVTWDASVVACLASISGCSEDDLDGLYPAQLPLVDGAPNIDAIDWSSQGTAAGTFGKYYLEFLGTRPVPGEGHKKLSVYRITSFAMDSTNVSKTRVQTIYRRCVTKEGLPCAS
jgi:Tfp pilus assembly protein PilX